MTTPDEAATTDGPRATGGGQVAAPPGGPLLAVAKRGAEHLLWARVALQRRTEGRRGRTRRRPVPATVPPTAVLRRRADWERAVAEGRHLRLPLHRDQPKNWDAIGAVGAVLTLADDGSRRARVMDAGSARYSPVLPWLRLYGLGEEPGSLLGIDIEFGDAVHRDGVVFRHGDVTATGLPDASLDAVTCMSVIEHGVPVEAFLRESARVLRPGGRAVPVDRLRPGPAGHDGHRPTAARCTSSRPRTSAGWVHRGPGRARGVRRPGDVRRAGAQGAPGPLGPRRAGLHRSSC